MLFSTFMRTKVASIASAIAKALIPSFLKTFIPISRFLFSSKFEATVVKLTSDLFDKLSLTNGASPKFSIIMPSTPPSVSPFMSF